MNSPTTSRTIAVVSAGLSVPSSTRLLADRLSAATASALAQRGHVADIQVVELREHARHLADNLITGFRNAQLGAAVELVTGADAVIAVTPIFSASYSGLFKTFFDVLDAGALAGTPVLIGATAGTARHSLVLEHAMSWWALRAQRGAPPDTAHRARQQASASLLVADLRRPGVRSRRCNRASRSSVARSSTR